VKAISKGALNFVEKPHTNDALPPILQQALELEATWHQEAKRCTFLESMWDSLSAQQKKVAVLVAEGDSNRNIASKLNIVERTVEEHRRKAFEKLGVDTSAQLATTVAAMKLCGIDCSLGTIENSENEA
jgi:FixJ family two-component response regulator